MKPKFRYEVNVELFEQMHTLVLILSHETEYPAPAFTLAMNVMSWNSFVF